MLPPDARESAPEGAPLISPPASEDTDNVPAGVTTEHPGAAAFTALPEVERRQIARNWDLDDLTAAGKRYDGLANNKRRWEVRFGASLCTGEAERELEKMTENIDPATDRAWVEQHPPPWGGWIDWADFWAADDPGAAVARADRAGWSRRGHLL